MVKKKQTIDLEKSSSVKVSACKSFKDSFNWQALIPPSILVLLTTFFYYFSLNYPFQFDDIANITKKFAIRFDNPLARWWTNSRWLGDWLNRMNFEIGRFDQFYYRAFNLVIHILAGVVIFYLIKALCEYLTEKPFFSENSTILAFVSAGLFLLHPVQTQAVSYVIQARIEGLATFFSLFIILCFVKMVSARTVLVKGLLGILMFVAGLLACGTKEMVIVTPLLMILVDWFFISQENWDSFKSRLWVHVVFTSYIFGLMVHYLSPKFATDAITFSVVTGNNRGNILTPDPYDIITPFQFLYSEFKVILHYLWMFVWPFNISVEYDWIVARSFWSAEVISSLFALLSMIGLALYFAFKKINTFYTFGLFWFLVAMAPRVTIIPSPELVCDYKTYLASVGWLFVIAVILVAAVSWVLQRIKAVSDSPYAKHAPLAVLSLILALSGVATYSRNLVWSSCVIFWEDNAKKAPLKARVHNNFGVALSEAGRIDESIGAYLKAIELDKHYSDPLSNLAVAYSLKEETDKAIESLKAAINLCPNYPEALNNLGTLFIKKKQYDDAERILRKAIELRPYYGKAWYNLGRLFLEQNKEELAWEHFKKAVEGDLDNADGFFTFGQMCIRMHKYAEAAQAFETVINSGIENDNVSFNLANAYYMLQKYDQALKIYNKLVNKNPLEGRYLFNLAEAVFAKGDYAAAMELFKKITGLPQPLPQAFFRITHCLEKMNKVDEAKAHLAALEKLNAPDEFKKIIGNEKMRLTLQDQVSKNGNKITLTDFKKAVALKHTVTLEKQDSNKKAIKHS